jgi:hypothetical protein
MTETEPEPATLAEEITENVQPAPTVPDAIETVPENASPAPTLPDLDQESCQQSPTTLQRFHKIFELERDGGSVIVVKDDNDEYCMQVMSKLQPRMEVVMVDMHEWNEYATWKRQHHARIEASKEEDTENHRQRLESTIVAMQMVCPGRWDHKFLNERGEPYIESVVGVNPLANGYSYCAPCEHENSRTEPEQGLAVQPEESQDPEDVTVPGRTFTIEVEPAVEPVLPGIAPEEPEDKPRVVLERTGS